MKSVINSIRGDAITRIVYRRMDNRVSHKLDWSRPVELKTEEKGYCMNLYSDYWVEVCIYGRIYNQNARCLIFYFVTIWL